MPAETIYSVAADPFDEERDVPTFHDFAIVADSAVSGCRGVVSAKRGNGRTTVQTYVNRSIAERQLRTVQRTLPAAELWCRYGG